MRIRRVGVVSEPLPEYPRWEHACTDVNIEAGEDIRWLPGTKAAGLLLPGADCWVSGHRVVRWNFQRGVSVPPPARLAAARPMLNLAAAFMADASLTIACQRGGSSSPVAGCHAIVTSRNAWERTGTGPCHFPGDGDAQVCAMPEISGETLRAWRRSRGWDVPGLARRLRKAAGNDPVPVHDALVRMIYRRERLGLRTERYELLCLRLGLDEAEAAPPGEVAARHRAPGGADAADEPAQFTDRWGDHREAPSFQDAVCWHLLLGDQAPGRSRGTRSSGWRGSADCT